MEKLLKPYTIIPPALYVQRDADTQVKNIINDMGRPGYVLVSRQMGKTNLLLNAKETLERPQDAFIYVDLSNTFPTAKACFENIIDSALDAYPEKFELISKTIAERRKELVDTPAHKQHTNELRFLLRALSGGKLVIILDEIDALTKTDYSDQIFSQIRSTYFASRVNYKEFNSLTYLLSGVVEPNEIIKDPKVSPFNIGQKIYLNDFTKDEFTKFIAAAKLDIDGDCIDRIFYWTNGNPRISWDVCAEVETRITTTRCNAILIDKIVQELYLTTFDKAPIDNIREIVLNDREIRNAIVEIEYKKGRSVSDKIKSKLYLSGIINYDEDDIHIKNRILRKSLSYEWIRSIEEKEKGLISIAFEEYKSAKFSESLATFEKYLSIEDIPEGPDRANTFYVIGHCAYATKNFDKALEYFNRANFDIEDEPLWHFKTLSYKGLSLYQLNRFEESLECLKVIIDHSKKDAVYATALLNYGSIAFKSDTLAHRDAAIEIFNEIINETAFSKDKLKSEFINELKSIAHFNLGQLSKLDGDIITAKSNYIEAIKLGKLSNRPRYILALAEVNDDKEETSLYLESVINSLVDRSITPSAEDPEKPMDFNYEDFKRICVLVFAQNQETFFKHLSPYLHVLGDYPLLRHLYNLALFSINWERVWTNALPLLHYVYDQFSKPDVEIDNETRYNTLKLLAYGSNTDVIVPEYIQFFSATKLFPVDFIDLEIFINYIFAAIEKRDYKDANEKILIINEYRANSETANMLNYLVIDYLEMAICRQTFKPNEAVKLAKKIIDASEDETVKSQRSNFLGESGLEIIKQNAESVLSSSRPTVPIKNTKVYGRNSTVKVRYKDGTTIETKFKKVEKDLEKGECLILE